jgi:hypothetical protein
VPTRFAPQAAVHALGPLSLSRLGVFAKRCLFFEFVQSINDASSVSRRYQVGPACQFHPLPRAGRPKSCLHRASPHLIAPCLPASIIETPIRAPYSPTLILPLESPLTPPRPSLASAINRRPLLTSISTPSSPGPLKKASTTPGFHRTPPRPFSPLSTLEQRSDRAPLPLILHRRRPASMLLLHLR